MLKKFWTWFRDNNGYNYTESSINGGNHERCNCNKKDK